MKFELVTGTKRIESADFPGVVVEIRPLTVAQAADVGVQFRHLHHGVVSVTGVTAGDKPINTGAELATAIGNAAASKGTMAFVNWVIGEVMAITELGEDEVKNSEPSQL